MQIVGSSAALKNVLNAAELVAHTDVSVLILGESGSGKELLAHQIHQQSQRADKPFVSVNCASLSTELADSLLFGHRKGAFTGADRDHDGYIKAAHGGTLFLDEIAEMPLASQAKLLRFLESGESYPVGSSSSHYYDVRIVAATHRDLQAKINSGEFREDLYYRLNIVPLEVPPLRERREDIVPLLNQIGAKLAERHKLTAPSYSREAQQALSAYRWPGNVRELRNLCERMLILCNGREIGVNNLPHEIRQPISQNDSERGFQLPSSGVDLAEVEKSFIQQALVKSGGNQSRAARLLGLTRDTLLYRLKKYAIRSVA